MITPTDSPALPWQLVGTDQVRNDATERVDEILRTELGLVDAASAQTDAPTSKVSANARLNSETLAPLVSKGRKLRPARQR